MAERTAIEWCDATFNPWWGCVKVSPACDHCYAERDAKRFASGQVLWGVGAERRTFGEKHWKAPGDWAKTMPAKLGRRPRVFCASMGDWLDLDAPLDQFVRLLDTIRLTPELDWLLLSKRIGNWEKRLHEAARKATGWLRDWIIEWLGGRPPANVWLASRRPAAFLPTLMPGQRAAGLDVGGHRCAQADAPAEVRQQPDSYVIDRGADGRVLPKDAQVRMCGNSVCPPLARAIVLANYSERQALRTAA